MVQIKTEQVSISLLKVNDAIADELRQFFDEKKIFTINLLSAPGSGKTTFLENMVQYFNKQKTCVLTGDLETERDALRLRKKGVPCHQIITGGGCHLEAIMIKQALNLLPPSLDYLFIENVGNLVCPASYSLGEHLRLVMLSSPEGDDKVLKYPKVFLSADVLIVSKSDLISILPFSVEKVVEEAKKVNPNIEIFVLSGHSGEGVEEFANFIKEKREATW